MKRLIALAFLCLSFGSAYAQQPSTALQDAQQDASDAKLMLGNAEVQIARLQRYIEMLKQRNDRLQKQVDGLTPKKPAPAGK